MVKVVTSDFKKFCVTISCHDMIGKYVTSFFVEFKSLGWVTKLAFVI